MVKDGYVQTLVVIKVLREFTTSRLLVEVSKEKTSEE
jgi:hypothetical protein